MNRAHYPYRTGGVDGIFCNLKCLLTDGILKAGIFLVVGRMREA